MNKSHSCDLNLSENISILEQLTLKQKEKS